MHNKISLDNRLRMCADFVRQNSRLADIGTDHAYLPLWLCLNGVCPSAIAADINPEPLSRGKEAIDSLNAGNMVTARLSDGLKNIDENEADDFVIAGMGGELIASILDSCPYSKNSSKHFILQPMTKSEVLIKYLFDNGFEILKQDCCTAGKKCYTILLVCFSGKKQEYTEAELYSAKLQPKLNPTHRLFIEKHISKLEKRAKGDPHYFEIAKELREIL